MISNIVAVLIVRCTHTGFYKDGRVNTGSVTLYDLDEITIQKTRTRAVPIPPGTFVDIPMSTRTFVSYHNGAICKHVKNGEITAEVILQLRQKGHKGGPAGTGQALRPAVLNAERVNDELRLVLPDNVIPTNLDSVGFMRGEPVAITGFTGAFYGLDGEYVITSAVPGDGLAGVQAGSYLVVVPSEGPDIAAATLSGVNLALSDECGGGRVVTQFNSSGDVGGFGTNVFGYIGGQLFPNAGGVGAGIIIEDEGIVVDAAATLLNFIGDGVTATSTGPGDVDVSIPGDVKSFTSGEALSVGDVLTLNAAGQVIRADASIAGGRWEVIGISKQAVAAFAPVQVYTKSGSCPNVRFGAPPAAALNGTLVFLDSVLGQASTTPPVGGGRTFFTVGTLQGADGITITPAVVFRPQFIAHRR